MFTGIIQTTGVVARIEGKIYTIAKIGEPDRGSSRFLDDAKIGMSIAVNGVCLTIIKFDQEEFMVEVMPETVRKTSFRILKVGDKVNLEKALAVGDRWEGHMVQGHVDQAVLVLDITPDQNSYLFKFALPQELQKYVVPKGSVAVNGISLTVMAVEDTCFTVGIIPHTMQKTMLSEVEAGGVVNVEVDILGKYIEKMIGR
jgi:riboflavin synthase